MKSMTALFFLGVISTTIISLNGYSVILEDADTKELRAFDFPDEAAAAAGILPAEQPPPMDIPQFQYDVEDPLVRQGITNGTVIVVPSKWEYNDNYRILTNNHTFS